MEGKGGRVAPHRAVAGDDLGPLEETQTLRPTEDWGRNWTLKGSALFS